MVYLPKVRSPLIGIVAGMNRRPATRHLHFESDLGRLLEIASKPQRWMPRPKELNHEATDRQCKRVYFKGAPPKSSDHLRYEIAMVTISQTVAFSFVNTALYGSGVSSNTRSL